MAGISLRSKAATPIGTHDASGSVLIGENTSKESTPGDYVTVLGDYAGAATYGTALGVGARAYAPGSVAVGINSDAGNGAGRGGTDDVAVGAGATTAPGIKNTAVGGNAKAGDLTISDSYSTAVGGDSVAKLWGTAVGHGSTASGATSVALGKNATATHAGATAIGKDAVTTKDGQVRLGTTTGEVSIPSCLALPTEQGPPLAPTTGCKIYTQDNGSGKTKLMVLFPTGAAVQIAIEP